MDREMPGIDETVYLHTNMAIPLRSKYKLIIPFDTITYTYLIKEQDVRILLKYIKKKELDSTLWSLKYKQKLNPYNNSIPLYKFSLSITMLFICFLLLYVSLGFIIIGLFNPIIFIFFLVFQIKVAQKIWGVGLLLLQKRKMKDLKQFLQKENERYYALKRIEWSLGEKGNWLQIDIKKGFLSNKKENSYSPPKKGTFIN